MSAPSEVIRFICEVLGVELAPWQERYVAEQMAWNNTRTPNKDHAHGPHQRHLAQRRSR